MSKHLERVMSFNKAILTSVLLLVSAVGCGQYGGGAAVVPEVTFVPAELGAAAVGDAAKSDIVAGPAGAPGAMGAMKGRIVLNGAVPSLPLLVAQGSQVKDPEVCAASDVPDERVVASADGGLANVFIYLPKAPRGGKPLAESEEPVIFDQKNCRFLPHCLVIPTGRTVRILSGDNVAHNTHTYPNKNDGISQTIPVNDRVGQVNFVYRRAESVPLSVTCDFHVWMKAWHLPLDHPYAAVSDANGEFQIPDLPAGKHSFTVWHESVDGNYIERKLVVDVKAGETAQVTVEVPVTRLKL